MWRLQVDDDENIERHKLNKNEDGTYTVDDEDQFETLEDALRSIKER